MLKIKIAPDPSGKSLSRREVAALPPGTTFLARTLTTKKFLGLKIFRGILNLEDPGMIWADRDNETMPDLYNYEEVDVNLTWVD
jgi:hypothetical protein